MTQHTTEPWKVSLEDSTPEWSVITAAGGRVVANVNEETGPELIAGVPVMRVMPGELNARRIVACVNACTGLPTEWLEKNALTDCTSSHKLIKQRDELLAALEDAVETIEWMNGCSSPAVDEVEKAIREGNSAISKAKGGAA